MHKRTLASLYRQSRTEHKCMRQAVLYQRRLAVRPITSPRYSQA